MAANDKKATTAEKAVNSKSVATAPTYTVEEFAAAPQILGLKSPDLVRAALKNAGKESATVDEAKNIVNKFKNKEVK